MPQSFPHASSLLAPIVESAAMADIFGDLATVQAMLDFEAALAEAEAETGIIPAEAGAPIRAACRADAFDIGALGESAALAGNPAIPLVKALTAQVAAEARGYVHWGATSQDVVDTAFMLCARRGLDRLAGELREAIAACVALAEEGRGALMAGRTFLQQALPTTFGHKAAVWLSGLVRARAEVRRVRAASIALQFGGAVGTLAALGADGLKVRAALARILGLPEAPVSWHAERSRVFAIAAALAGASGAAAKIAGDVALMMQSEVGEAFEPAAEGKGGSSTMPHKRNPVAAAAIRANHLRIAGTMATMTLAIAHEHERAAGAWTAEWQAIRELFRLAGGSVERLADMLGGLETDAPRMRANLDAGLGLPLAESLMMALAPRLGRGEAHRAVTAAARRAAAERRPLFDVASEDAAISAALDKEAIAAALDPERYLGVAGAMAEAALSEARREMETD
jgi:3-carboxy-cis,cis-muconate cycloisomerase